MKKRGRRRGKGEEGEEDGGGGEDYNDQVTAVIWRSGRVRPILC